MEIDVEEFSLLLLKVYMCLKNSLKMPTNYVLNKYSSSSHSFLLLNFSASVFIFSAPGGFHSSDAEQRKEIFSYFLSIFTFAIELGCAAITIGSTSSVLQT
jgi:hypothetical protein